MIRNIVIVFVVVVVVIVVCNVNVNVWVWMWMWMMNYNGSAVDIRKSGYSYCSYCNYCNCCCYITSKSWTRWSDLLIGFPACGEGGFNSLTIATWWWWWWVWCCWCWCCSSITTSRCIAAAIQLLQPLLQLLLQLLSSCLKRTQCSRATRTISRTWLLCVYSIPSNHATFYIQFWYIPTSSRVSSASVSKDSRHEHRFNPLPTY